ncbi:MAG: hypothetical protein IPM13_08830 [Phycisphaerales bacterium]|nr:hypothetical protein [Phycisphaerales bacterium]
MGTDYEPDLEPQRVGRRAALLLAAGLVAVICAAQDTGVVPPQPPRAPPALQALVQRVFSGIEGLDVDWREQGAFANEAMASVFEANGWTSEPDLFALDVALELNTRAPWEIDERVDILSSRLAERYVLNEDQEQLLRTTLVREANDFFATHGGELLPMMVEAAQTRFSNTPFTAEQVARWSQTLGPLLDDVRQRFDVRVHEYMKLLDPDQQAWVQIDLQAADRRLNRVSELGAQWQAGQWSPADWGLAGDPIQQGAIPPQSPRAPANPAGTRVGDAAPESATPTGASMGAPASPAEGGQTASPRASEGAPALGKPNQPPAPRTAAQPGESGPWAEYVRAFIRRYNLDEGQQQRAWLMYKDAKERREQHERRYKERSARLGQSGDDASVREALEKLGQSRSTVEDRIFDDLKRRLERLPTRAQRRTAEQEAPVTTRPAGRGRQ